jgi:hypothetical protein
MPLTKGEEKTLKGVRKMKERLAKIQKRYKSDVPNIFRNAGLIIANSAKQILTAKGHILTGALRRSLTAMITELKPAYIEVSVGTWLEYAPLVEALPDGGYLYEAFEKQKTVVVNYIKRQLASSLRRETEK